MELLRNVPRSNATNQRKNVGTTRRCNVDGGTGAGCSTGTRDLVIPDTFALAAKPVELDSIMATEETWL